MAELTKEARIKSEKTRLRRRFADIGKDKLTTVEKLIDRVAFLTVTMEDLEEALNENGCVSTYQNGENQWGTKKSPEAELYGMMQRYLPAMKQLLDLLPEATQPKASDPLMDFMNGDDASTRGVLRRDPRWADRGLREDEARLRAHPFRLRAPGRVPLRR